MDSCSSLCFPALCLSPGPAEALPEPQQLFWSSAGPWVCPATSSHRSDQRSGTVRGVGRERQEKMPRGKKREVKLNFSGSRWGSRMHQPTSLLLSARAPAPGARERHHLGPGPSASIPAPPPPSSTRANSRKVSCDCCVRSDLQVAL